MDKWGLEYGRLLNSFNERDKELKEFLIREQTVARFEKDEKLADRNYLDYCRGVQEAAGKAIRELDGLSPTPAKAQHLSDLTRKLFRRRLTSARFCAESVMKGDTEGRVRLGRTEPKEIADLQREIALEGRRLAPAEEVRAADEKFAREQAASGNRAAKGGFE